MIKKTIIILGGVASLMFANSAANAQIGGNRAYCDDYARRVAYRSADPNAVVGGAVTGAILGGAFGALTGQGHASNIGTGVVVGGAAGGVLGAAGSQGHVSQRGYDRAYWDCMNRSNFHPANRHFYNGNRTYYGQPIYNNPVGYSRNRGWCASRYRSYNPNTGLYLSSSGGYRHCP